ncbi:hypothetical protein GCM10010841_26700 [Deinococcus aerophilus]|uniref:SPOR domain-containing protein n=1 Tax=Deinococcus aerophilus TaxID=522488 RepID=A0ABQ2GYA2_9DEIO|nr:hypothetical protein GCM10010841_26700 [Deinococcus aerophilus]
MALGALLLTVMAAGVWQGQRFFQPSSSMSVQSAGAGLMPPQETEELESTAPGPRDVLSESVVALDEDLPGESVTDETPAGQPPAGSDEDLPGEPVGPE